MREFVIICNLLALAACAQGPQVGCNTILGQPTAHMNSENNASCPVGQVLTGYDTNAIAGPLLCSTLTVSCPLPGK